MLSKFKWLVHFDTAPVLDEALEEDNAEPDLVFQVVSFVKYKILLEFVESHPLSELKLFQLDKVLKRELYASSSENEGKKEVTTNGEGLLENIALIGIAFLVMMFHYVRLFSYSSPVF